MAAAAPDLLDSALAAIPAAPVTPAAPAAPPTTSPSLSSPATAAAPAQGVSPQPSAPSPAPLPGTPSEPAPAAPAGKAEAPAAAPAAPPAPKRPTLFDLEAEYLSILITLDEGGEISEPALAELAERLTQVDEAVDRKVEGWTRWIRQLEADGDVAKAEAKRLGARGGSYEKLADRLRDKLRDAMTAMGKEKVKTALFTVSVKKSPPRVIDVDLANVPRRLVKIVESPDLGQILDEFKRSKVIPPYARIATDRTHLEIR